MGKYSAAVDDHLILPAVARLSQGEEYRRRRAGTGVPTAVSIRLLIDTGSKRTTLIPGLIGHLGPMITERVRVETSLRAGRTHLFWVGLDFPQAGLASFDPLQV